MTREAAVGRPPLPLGTYGKILFLAQPSGQVKARVKFRDFDGRVRQVGRVASSRAAAERALKADLANRQAVSSGKRGFKTRKEAASALRAEIRRSEVGEWV
jgi:hypothetical protein